MYDLDLLIDLIKAAKGYRSLNQFAKECAVDAGNISRLLNKKSSQPPRPGTLKKIADHAHNNVTYDKLMMAAGYINIDDAEENSDFSPLSPKDENEIEKKIEALKKDLSTNADGLMLSGNPVSPEAIESIIEALSYGIRQAKIVNKKYTPIKYKK